MMSEQQLVLARRLRQRTNGASGDRRLDDEMVLNEHEESLLVRFFDMLSDWKHSLRASDTEVVDVAYRGNKETSHTKEEPERS